MTQYHTLTLQTQIVVMLSKIKVNGSFYSMLNIWRECGTAVSLIPLQKAVPTKMSCTGIFVWRCLEHTDS